MIDKKISIGTLLTIGTVLAGIIYTHGVSTEKIETVKTEHINTVKRVKVNEDSIVDLKIGQKVIETKLDDRFNRLEEILMDK
tara:strand:+ start:210 stop:455 length:246 start_codon:yes stop_codon:yes gene_type:complete